MNLFLKVSNRKEILEVWAWVWDQECNNKVEISIRDKASNNNSQTKVIIKAMVNNNNFKENLKVNRDTKATHSKAISNNHSKAFSNNHSKVISNNHNIKAKVSTNKWDNNHNSLHKDFKE